MKRVTITDVAHRAGVSKSTVSHALSDKRPISEATKARIQQVIVELGYEPNPIAQKLAGAGAGRTNIGFALPLILPEIDGLEIKFIASAAQTISKCGYTFVLISDTDRAGGNLLRFIDNGVVDGFILMQVQLHDPRVELLVQRDVPFVLIGRCEENEGIAWVDSDILSGMTTAVGHLAELGHEKLLYLYQDDLSFGFASRSLQAFHNVCADYGLESLTEPCDLTASSGEAALYRVLDSDNSVTAIIVWNDAAAMGVIQAANSWGLRVPEDLSVICTNDTTISRLAAYKPTMIDIQPQALATNAARMLIRILEEHQLEVHQVLIPPRFIIGNTTSRPHLNAL